MCGATPSRRRSSQCASGRFASNLGTITPHRLLRRKAEDRILPGPYGRQIGEAGYPHPVRKPPLYSGSDQIRREERKRDRHIDLADAAALPFSDAFRACRWIPDQFIKRLVDDLDALIGALGLKAA